MPADFRRSLTACPSGAHGRAVAKLVQPMSKDRAKKPLPESHGLTEAQLDEALEETFPASDPSSQSPTSVGRADPAPAKPGRKSGKRPQARR
jgi:hypothetical protein